MVFFFRAHSSLSSKDRRNSSKFHEISRKMLNRRDRRRYHRRRALEGLAGLPAPDLPSRRINNMVTRWRKDESSAEPAASCIFQATAGTKITHIRCITDISSISAVVLFSPYLGGAIHKTSVIPKPEESLAPTIPASPDLPRPFPDVTSPDFLNVYP